MDRVDAVLLAPGILRDQALGGFYFSPAEILRALGGAHVPEAARIVARLVSRALDVEEHAERRGPLRRVPMAMEDV